MLRLPAAAEDMHVHAAMIACRLRSAWRRGVIQRPIARLEVVDAAASELRHNVDHRAADGADEDAPVHELDIGELALLPYRARRVDDQVSAVGAVEKHRLRHNHRPPGALVNDAQERSTRPAAASVSAPRSQVMAPLTIVYSIP